MTREWRAWFGEGWQVSRLSPKGEEHHIQYEIGRRDHAEALAAYLNALEARAGLATELGEALSTALMFVNQNMPPAPGHSCGPESSCDMLCVEFAYASKVRDELKRALARLREAEVQG